jgi:hypothetical protein
MSGNCFEDNQVMNRMQVMCAESLCPEHYKIWEIIKKALYETRSSLKESTSDSDKTIEAIELIQVPIKDCIKNNRGY